MSEVYTKVYPAPPVDKKAVLRYSGAADFTAETEALYKSCLEKCLTKTVYRLCYTELPLVFEADGLIIGNNDIRSKDLKKALNGCHSAIIFAATVGIEYDRLIAGYGRVSAAKALMFQAIGTERVESLCDVFCRDIAAEKLSLGEKTTPRFSPGYGDLPLVLQRQIFDILDCERKIGIFLNDSLLMTPSKSVTAIIGVK